MTVFTQNSKPKYYLEQAGSMKTTNIPKLKNLHRLILRCVLSGSLLLPVTLAFGQDTPVPVDTLFQQLKQRTEQAVLNLDRPQIKLLGQEIMELGEQHKRQDIFQWGALYHADGLIREDPNQAKVLLEDAVSYFKDQGNDLTVARCYNLLGSVLSNINQVQEGIDYYHKALEVYEAAMPVDTPQSIQRNITGILSNIGLSYTRISLFDQAADYLFEAEKKAIRLGDTLIMTAITNSLGNVFFLADQIEESYSYYKRSLDLAIAQNHLQSVRMAYTGLGNAFFRMEKLDSALYYTTRSVALLRSGNNLVSLCIALSNQANVYGAMGNCEKADSISHEVLEIARKKQMIRYEALAYFNMAECALAREAYDMAIQYADLSYDIIDGTGDLKFIKDIFAVQYLAYEGQKNYEQAFLHHKKYKEISDSSLNENSLAKIQELQTRYETERKEREIERLNETNRIQELEYRQTLSWLVIGLIGLSLAGAVFFFFNRQRILLANNQKLEVEQRLLRSQMNPHFIFNALTSIQSFLLTEGQAQKGAYYLTKFAKLIRRILEHSRVTFVPLSDELETLDHYLALQQLRYEKQFDYEITVDTQDNPEDISFPPMLLQPAVENAIEHGDLAKVPNGRVRILVDQTEANHLRVRVQDNGVGRSTAKLQHNGRKTHRSLATVIIRERIELLQKTYNQHIRYQIDDVAEGGTVVTYDFPLKPQS